jgi:two-component system alkaline phosphatase synthesis response regulator PhoP
LLDKYEWRLPKISSQKFNKRIQKICKKIGLDNEVTKHIRLLKEVKTNTGKDENRKNNIDLLNEALLNLKENKDKILKEEYVVYKAGKRISLPRKEFELFSLLTSKPGKVFKREVILDTVWGNEVVVGGRTIDVHIRKLREKIGDDHFKTVKGVGYKFVLLDADK